tara:strand:+ start:874 stop:1164 length:291 start_codon:yes stop_codon:yes gene_type:complete
LPANSTEIASVIGGYLDLQAAIIAEQEGVLVKTLGDGSMSSFGSASSALRAAIKTQTASAEVDSDSNLKLRICIHAGDVIQTEAIFLALSSTNRLV